VGRFLSLSLPGFAIDRIRGPGAERKRRASSPLLLVATTRGSRWVAAASPGAARLGVRAGMSLAHARALIGDRELALEPFDPDGDRRALEELGAWAMRFSPLVAADPPDGLLIDVAGNERLFGSEEKLVDLVLDAFGARGFRARAAVADTIGCAWAVARFGASDRARVAPGGEVDALGPLPTSALRLEPHTVDALGEVGIERIAHLFELSRDALPARFGDELLLRLDQALGNAFEVMDPLRPVLPPRAVRVFEAPVDAGRVRAAVRELLERLTEELRARGEGARRLELEQVCAQAPPVRVEIVLHGPSGDADHLGSLLEPRLERAHLGFGVERIVLAAPATAPTPLRQTSAWSEAARASSARHDRALNELLDTLIDRLGRDRVLGVEPVESHVPELAFRVRPCLDPPAGPAAGRVTPVPRPSHLFASPDPVVVDAQEGDRPVRFRWRGETWHVARCFGPERIEAPWWTAGRNGWARGARDYFRIEDRSGRWLWMGRHADGRWFVHGEWR